MLKTPKHNYHWSGSLMHSNDKPERLMVRSPAFLYNTVANNKSWIWKPKSSQIFLNTKMSPKHWTATSHPLDNYLFHLLFFTISKLPLKPVFPALGCVTWQPGLMRLCSGGTMGSWGSQERKRSDSQCCLALGIIMPSHISRHPTVKEGRRKITKATLDKLL